jgi:hypothetical protein
MAALISESVSSAMDFPPSGKKRLLLVLDDLHGAAHIVPLHALGPDKRWSPVRPDQVDLDLPVTEHMHMGRLMIVCEDDDAQTMRSVYGDHN